MYFFIFLESKQKYTCTVEAGRQGARTKTLLFVQNAGKQHAHARTGAHSNSNINSSGTHTRAQTRALAGWLAGCVAGYARGGR